MGKKIFASHIYDKELIYIKNRTRYIKELRCIKNSHNSIAKKYTKPPNNPNVKRRKD